MKDEESDISGSATRLRHIGLFLSLALSTCGCSALMIVSALVPSPEQQSWTIDAGHSLKYPRSGGLDFYGAGYICGGDSIHFSSVFLGGWDMMGPPLVPLIPVPVGSRDTLFLTIDVSNGRRDSTFQSPNIALKVSSTSQIYLPSRVHSLGRSRWMYKFDLRAGNLSEFEVEFLTSFNGCTVETLHYRRERQSRYVPFLIPVGGV